MYCKVFLFRDTIISDKNILGMKKIILMSIFGLMAVAANASTGTVLTTSCGKQRMTVGPEFFATSQDFMDYLGDLNEMECGDRWNWSATIR